MYIVTGKFIIWHSGLLRVDDMVIFHMLNIQHSANLFPWCHQNVTKLILVCFNIGILPQIHQINKFKAWAKFPAIYDIIQNTMFCYQ